MVNLQKHVPSVSCNLKISYIKAYLYTIQFVACDSYSGIFDRVNA